MRFCWFASFEGGEPLREEEAAAIGAFVAATPRLALAEMHLPAAASDIYTDDGPSPELALQLYFDEIADLEAALAEGGHLQALARPSAFASLAGRQATHQAFCVRRFDVEGGAAPEPRCSFLVHYPGPAADLNAWLSHYIASHPPIMRRFPGIRQIEILTGLDWIDAMPFPRAGHMQRNRVVFDSPEALTAALRSPTRHEMRADYHRFPPFEGGSRHFPVWTRTVGRRAP
jgi:hypothetical protein